MHCLGEFLQNWYSDVKAWCDHVSFVYFEVRVSETRNFNVIQLQLMSTLASVLLSTLFSTITAVLGFTWGVIFSWVHSLWRESNSSYWLHFWASRFSRPRWMVYERMLAFGGLTCLILLANGKGVWVTLKGRSPVEKRQGGKFNVFHSVGIYNSHSVVSPLKWSSKCSFSAAFPYSL